MNKGEYGVAFLYSTGFDMSSQTSVSLLFWKPDNPWSEDTNSTPSLTKTSGVTVGAAPIVTTLGTFATNKYLKYTFVNGDVDQDGVWSCRATYNDATGQHLISDVSEFTVYP